MIRYNIPTRSGTLMLIMMDTEINLTTSGNVVGLAHRFLQQPATVTLIRSPAPSPSLSRANILFLLLHDELLNQCLFSFSLNSP